MMHKDEIIRYLHEINDILRDRDIKGEICLYGGAVMSLVYNARPNTKDVDAIFKPANAIREAARELAQEHALPKDWLNDAVKGFLVEHNRDVFSQWSNLVIYAPEPDYLLAMKCMAARVDATDNVDIRFLIAKLELKSPRQVFEIIEKYYPKGRIKPATQFFIEEIFENQ